VGRCEWGQFKRALDYYYLPGMTVKLFAEVIETVTATGVIENEVVTAITFVTETLWHDDNQHNDTQHNDTRHLA
jgi:hypothetical protein